MILAVGVLNCVVKLQSLLYIMARAMAYVTKKLLAKDTMVRSTVDNVTLVETEITSARNEHGSLLQYVLIRHILNSRNSKNSKIYEFSNHSRRRPDKLRIMLEMLVDVVCVMVVVVIK
jgi:hypothetical protein